MEYDRLGCTSKRLACRPRAAPHEPERRSRASAHPARGAPRRSPADSTTRVRREKGFFTIWSTTCRTPYGVRPFGVHLQTAGLPAACGPARAGTALPRVRTPRARRAKAVSGRLDHSRPPGERIFYHMEYDMSYSIWSTTVWGAPPNGPLAGRGRPRATRNGASAHPHTPRAARQGGLRPSRPLASAGRKDFLPYGVRHVVLHTEYDSLGCTSKRPACRPRAAPRDPERRSRASAHPARGAPRRSPAVSTARV